jgi:integral membrane protein
MRRTIELLRTLGFLEGTSYLVLLGIAMPLKYLYGEPLAVKIVGALHGALFVLYVGLAAWAGFKLRWSLRRLVMIFIASMLPFGPFVMDRSLRAES